MKKTEIASHLIGEALKQNKREAKISFKDHVRIVSFTAEKVIRSQHQVITIGRNESLGRLLVIDGEVQFTERDFSTYHELMVWPAMILRSGDNVAIYGGGDGLAAAEILKFKVTPTIVDLDDSVINVCREYFSDLNQGSLDKAKIIVGDALEHQPKDKYDVIFVDLTDQVACPFLYDEKAIAKYRGDLKESGIILFYGEYMLARKFYAGLKKHFRHSFAYGAFMQFVDSYFTFSLFCDKPINAAKLKRTKMEGRYFCRRHIHEVDFDHLPEMDFREFFEVNQVASFLIKG